MSEIKKVPLTTWGLQRIGISFSRHSISIPSSNPKIQEWYDDITEMYTDYFSGKPIYVEFTDNKRRTGSIGKISIQNMQDILHGSYNYYNRWQNSSRVPIAEKIENFDLKKAIMVNPEIKVTWDGRRNKVESSGHDIVWLKGHTGGTVWEYGTITPPKVQAFDKLGREINVGDFISYILYHYDSRGAAGIYYGKVTKITSEGTVYAKNIKLQDSDKVDEKRIKDNHLIVIMTKDLMDRLMMARLSVL